MSNGDEERVIVNVCVRERERERERVSERESITCPVAIKMALTTLAACALNPPTEPAMAEPTRFLLMFSSTKASTLVFNTYMYMYIMYMYMT